MPTDPAPARPVHPLRDNPLANLLKRVRLPNGSNLYRPRLIDLARAAQTISVEPIPIATALSTAAPSELAAYSEEFAALLSALIGRAGSASGLDAISMAMVREEVALMYLLARARRPKLVVETGVARGVSTYFLLHALRKNQVGRLTSFDLRSDAGELLLPGEREGWELVVLDRRRIRSKFHQRVSALTAPIDLFLHDSDHSYGHMLFEYETVLPRISPGGLLASDDVDCCFAFLDFCARHRLAPRILVAPTKAFGVAEASARL
jgi:predicted O-methyltransferase YrrM